MYLQSNTATQTVGL